MTALTAKNYLSRYAGSGNDFYQRLSLVNQRLQKAVNARGTKKRVVMNVNPDANNNAFVTLPREMNTVLGAVPMSCPSVHGGSPVKIQNDWYGYLDGDPGTFDGTWRDVTAMPGRFTTFADWTTPMFLRFRFETVELAGTIIIKAKLSGNKIYSTIVGTWQEGFALPYLGGATAVTTPQKVDEPPHQIVKPITNGRVNMSIVDPTTLVETPVAVYDPNEIDPAFRRYKVPVQCVFQA